MVRTILALSMVALLPVMAGCRMCAHPYDYCGPTFTGECGTCCPDARQGSRFSSLAQTDLPVETVPPVTIEPEVHETDLLEPVPDGVTGPALELEQQADAEKPDDKERFASLPQHRTLWK